MKLIIIGSGELVIRLIDECRNYTEICILGVVNIHVNKNTTDNTQREIDRRRVKSLQLDTGVLKEADIVLSFNCSVVLGKEIVEAIDIINMHVGILPRYRGNSANTWAIMNGEAFVGFTFHKVTEMLDAGDIYYQKKIPIEKNQTYADVYDYLMSSIIHDAPRVMLDIHLGNLEAHEQFGDYCYCSLFSSDMGYIKDFNVKSEYLYNLYRCMAKPHGTGIYTYKSGVLFEVRRVLMGDSLGVCDYIGRPGKIVNIANDALWVKTADNIIIFSDLYKDGQSIRVIDYFRNGQTIGE